MAWNICVKCITRAFWSNICNTVILVHWQSFCFSIHQQQAIYTESWMLIFDCKSKKKKKVTFNCPASNCKVQWYPPAIKSRPSNNVPIDLPKVLMPCSSKVSKRMKSQILSGCIPRSENTKILMCIDQMGLFYNGTCLRTSEICN